MPKVKKKYRVKWNNVFKLFMFLVVISLSIYGIVHFADYIFEYRKTVKFVSDLKRETTIEYVVDNESTIIVDTEDSKDKFSPYFIYVKQGMININFNELRKKVPDATAWVQIKNTSINSPVVNNGDGIFYKNHAFDKTSNRFGAIYVKGTLNDSNPVTVIQGNKSIFDLRFAFDEKWRDDNANFLIKFVTNEYTSLWQIVSVYKDKADTKTLFNTDEEYTQFLNDLIEKSDIDFKTSLGINDKLLVLESTDNIKVIGKLIKIQYL